MGRRNADRSSLAARGLLQLDARAIGQHGQGLREIDAFHLHDEAEDVAADVAGPALPRLPLGIDLQAGPGVVVPGAMGHVAAALAAERQIVLAQQIDDIDRLSNLFLGIKGRVEGHLRLPSWRASRHPFRLQGADSPHRVIFAKHSAAIPSAAPGWKPILCRESFRQGGILHGGQIIARPQTGQ